MSGIVGDLTTDTTLQNTPYSNPAAAVFLDKNYTGIWVAVLLVVVVYVFLAPFIKRRDLTIYLLVMIASGAAIFVGIWGSEWDIDSVFVAQTPYKVLADFEIAATVGIRVGLTGFNVTLLGEPRVQFGEVIDFNERFHWDWGRDILLEDFEAALLRGVPIPILSVAELMELDGEMIRFGRNYRVAGYWTFIFIIMAAPLWLISLVFASYKFEGHTRKYAGNMLLMVALSLGVAAGVYNQVKPDNFMIPFSGEEVVFLRPQLGFNYWFVVVALILSTLEGLYLIGTTKLVYETEEKAEGSAGPNAFRRFTQAFWRSATRPDFQTTLAAYREEEYDDENEEDDAHMYDPNMFAKSKQQRKISRGDVEIELEPPKSGRSRGSSRTSEKEYGSGLSPSMHSGTKMDPLITTSDNE